MIDSSRVVECSDGINRICYPEKYAEDMYHAFRTRYDLHHKVYQHRVVKSLEYMMIDAVYGARFRQKFTLEDAIGSHACSLEANMRVTNGTPLGSSLFYQLTLYIVSQHRRSAQRQHVVVRCSCFWTGHRTRGLRSAFGQGIALEDRGVLLDRTSH